VTEVEGMDTSMEVEGMDMMEERLLRPLELEGMDMTNSHT
jgi:hypothetical protein